MRGRPTGLQLLRDRLPTLRHGWRMVVFGWEQIPDAHVKMRKNEHKPGNMAVLVQSPKTGLRTFEEALAARG